MTYPDGGPDPYDVEHDRQETEVANAHDHLGIARNWAAVAEQMADSFEQHGDKDGRAPFVRAKFDHAVALAKTHSDLATAIGAQAWRDSLKSPPPYPPAQTTPGPPPGLWVGGGVPVQCGRCGGQHVGECTPPIPVRYASEGEHDYARDGAIREEGAKAALTRAAEMQGAAGKTDNGRWLRDCATIGLGGAWPEPRAFQGAVVHVGHEKMAADLDALDDNTVSALYHAIKRQQVKRGYTPPSPTGRLPDYPAPSAPDLPGYP